MPIVHPATLTPIVFTAVIAWAYYRRIRRQFGRQAYQPRRALARTVVLAIACCGFLVAAVALPAVGLGIVAGLLAGAVLGGIALRFTGIESTDGLRWYTPNPWIGGALSLLLVGRLAWRWGHGAFSQAGLHATRAASPLTMGLMAALVAFYVVNGAGLAWRMRALADAGTTTVA